VLANRQQSKRFEWFGCPFPSGGQPEGSDVRRGAPKRSRARSLALSPIAGSAPLSPGCHPPTHVGVWINGRSVALVLASGEGERDCALSTSGYSSKHQPLSRAATA